MTPPISGRVIVYCGLGTCDVNAGNIYAKRVQNPASLRWHDLDEMVVLCVDGDQQHSTMSYFVSLCVDITAYFVDGVNQVSIPCL